MACGCCGKPWNWLYIGLCIFVLGIGGFVTLFILFRLGVLSVDVVKFDIVNASLTEFNLTTNKTQVVLHYNLTLNITIWNPKSSPKVYYRRIEIGAYYKGKHFDTELMNTFIQDPGKTNMLSPVFQGKSPILLGGSELSDFARERMSNETFNIDIKWSLQYRTPDSENRFVTSRQSKTCSLRVPLHSPNGTLTKLNICGDS